MSQVLDSILKVLGLIGLDLLLLAGWLAVPLGLSGNFILLGAALLVALVTGFSEIGWLALIIMAAAAVVAEVIEAVLGSLVARKYGASKWGMIGAFVGGIAGAILGTGVVPLLGSLVGSFLGSAAGAMAFELLAMRSGGTQPQSFGETRPGLRAGWGAFLGKVLATGVKMAVATGIVTYVVLRTHF